MDKRRLSYRHTLCAGFFGYISQAIVNNLAPLLFLTFQREFSVSLEKIALLSSFNFAVQLAVDLAAARFADRIGYRACIVAAHLLAAAGLAGLGVLPRLMPDPFWGLLLAAALYAAGGGLIEVLVSPIAEACPTKNKAAVMSLLHSFYCWGHVGVVLLSTVFFGIFGIGKWKILTCIWIAVPLVNTFIFAGSPIAPLTRDGEKGLTISELFKSKTFWVLMLMMTCAGASEQAVSQWASTFAELGLGVSKTVGDLAGPMAFAVLMGSSRLFYGKLGANIDLDKFMAGSGILCVISYLCISLSASPVLSLAGCAVCGLSVGIMWPGTFSKAASLIKNGGTAMFALLALAGDLGCSGGPTLVGFISDIASDDLKKGILAAIFFPVLLTAGVVFLRRSQRAKSE